MNLASTNKEKVVLVKYLAVRIAKFNQQYAVAALNTYTKRCYRQYEVYIDIRKCVMTTLTVRKKEIYIFCL